MYITKGRNFDMDEAFIEAIRLITEYIPQRTLDFFYSFGTQRESISPQHSSTVPFVNAFLRIPPHSPTVNFSPSPLFNLSTFS